MLKKAIALAIGLLVVFSAASAFAAPEKRANLWYEPEDEEEMQGPIRSKGTADATEEKAAKFGEISLVSPITGSLTLSFTETISNVAELAGDDIVPGQSERGLLAKLDAAAKQAGQGRVEGALGALSGLVGQLNGMARAGHISAQDYAVIYSDYAALVTKLGGAPKDPIVLEQPAPEPAATPAPDPDDALDEAKPERGKKSTEAAEETPDRGKPRSSAGDARGGGRR